MDYGYKKPTKALLRQFRTSLSFAEMTALPNQVDIKAALLAGYLSQVWSGWAPEGSTRIFLTAKGEEALAQRTKRGKA